MKNKFFLFIICSLFLISLTSALDFPFAVNKIYETNVTEDTSDFLKTDFNSGYGLIKLSKTIFWIPTDKIAEYSLVENTEYCITDCYSKGKVTLYKDGKLFEDIYFIDIMKELKSFLQYSCLYLTFI